MIKIVLQERACDICGGKKLEEIWKYSLPVKTRNETFLWEIRNVVCRTCGFAFVSPAPTDDALTEYYGDSFSIYPNQVIDYSIPNRLHMIEKYIPSIGSPQKTYLEVGSNNCTEFLTSVSKLFDVVLTVDPNDSCTSTCGSLKHAQCQRADIICSYFVLEHVPNPKEFLSLSHNILKDGGILIIEVPNLHGYPKDPSGLFVHEHVNHFSPQSLTALANTCGLDLLEISFNFCSRTFGFVAVFEKSTSTNVPSLPVNPAEVAYSRACMQETAMTIQTFQKKVLSTREKISTISGQTQGLVILWAANAICSMLLEGYQLPQSTVIIDSDPRKKDYLSPLKVHQPMEALNQIARATFLIINTRRHAKDILSWIESHVNRRFSEQEILILDYL
jgi:SAM-dependent methyltransferase